MLSRKMMAGHAIAVDAVGNLVVAEIVSADGDIQTVEAMRVELMSRSDTLENAQRDTVAKKLEAEALLAELQGREKERLAERQMERELEHEREQEREKEREVELVARAERERLKREKDELEDAHATLMAAAEQKDGKQQLLLAEVARMEALLRTMQEQQESQIAQHRAMQDERVRLQQEADTWQKENDALQQKLDEQQVDHEARLREMQETERLNAQVFTEEQSQLLERALTAEKRVRELEGSLSAFVTEIEKDKPGQELLDLRRELAELKAQAEVAREKDIEREKDREEATELRNQIAKLQDDFCTASKSQLNESSNVIALKRQVQSLEAELVEKETLLYNAKAEDATSKEEVALCSLT